MRDFCNTGFVVYRKNILLLFITYVKIIKELNGHLIESGIYISTLESNLIINLFFNLILIFIIFLINTLLLLFTHQMDDDH